MKVLLTEEDERLATIERIAAADDVRLPQLRHWNYDACQRHLDVGPQPDCEYRACGGELFKHQRVGVSWAYFVKKGLLADDPGLGKQQPVSEPVLTPSGWVPIGSLSPGDLVISRSGTPTEVLGVFPQTERRVFKVTFNDGTYVLCGPEHLWAVKTHNDSNRGGDYRVVTTEDIAANLEARWEVPMVGPVEYGNPSPMSDPYLIGVILGDGSRAGLHNKTPGVRITTDIEIITALGYSYVPEPSEGIGTAYVPKKDRVDLPSLGTAAHKTIPETYLRAPAKDRLALLQGLLDTDGYPMPDGGIEFSSASENLASGVAELVRSLGGVCREHYKPVTTYTHNGEKRVGLPSYRLNVKLPSGMAPFRLSRKMDRYVPPTKYLPKRVIRSVEYSHEEDSVCILVKDEEHLYVTRDYTVTHNTGQVLGLIALMKQRHELNERAILIVQTPAVMQWLQEAERWTRGITFVAATGQMNRAERVQMYMGNWDVLIVGFHAALKDREFLENLAPYNLVVSDDVDPLLDHDNKTHEMIATLSEGAERSLTLNATVLQVRLQQLHAALVPCGGLEVFGSLKTFEREYVRREPIVIKRGKRVIRSSQIMGYKNLNLLRERMRGMVLRRRAEDVDDIRMPVLMPPSTVWLEMSPRQKKAYTELQKNTLILKKETGLTRAKAQARFFYGQMICAGMPALGEEDSPDASPKLDWLLKHLTTAWSGHKVVVFVRNVGLVKALESRCNSLGIGVAKIWGVKQNASQRDAEKTRFWQDPNCRVLVGTTAVERSLNLQVANIVVCVDTHLNPARMKQILGRVKRAGSRFKHVYMFTLLMSGTQEENYERILSQRQALNDAVFDEDSGLYEKLSPVELLNLITP